MLVLLFSKLFCIFTTIQSKKEREGARDSGKERIKATLMEVSKPKMAIGPLFCLSWIIKFHGELR